MTSRIFLYPKDIMLLTGFSYKGAWKRYQVLRDSLGKPKGKKITIREYCQMEDVPEAEVKKQLNIN